MTPYLNIFLHKLGETIPQSHSW